jgi:two-component system, sensor histidine kinase
MDNSIRKAGDAMTAPDLLPISAADQDQHRVRGEIARQFEILWAERWQRLSLTAVAYLLCTIYLPFWICAFCALVNILAEIAHMRMMRHVDPERDRIAYWASLVMVFGVELAYCLPPAMIWQMSEPYPKAFALGMITITMIHLTTVRAIFLPQGLAGFLGLAVAVVVGNTVFWLGVGDLAGLAVSTICASAGLAYTLTAMVSNNHLHRATAEGSAAAKAADAAKSRFLAQMSHELRTPLNAILGIGQTELRRTQDDRTRDRLEILVRAAHGLGIVLDDLLDMSAIQLGKLSIVPSDAPPARVVATTVGLFELQAEEAGLSLTLHTDANVPSLARFDEQRLRQCLSNLISNALKYTRSGDVTVSMRCTGQVGDYLEITVADTGPGIPRGAEHQIFEPFVRADGQVAGTGLGLAISRALAHRMGGDLVLVPKLAGQPGATFLLTIALASPSVAAGPDTAVEDMRLEGLRVLVVDDLATNRLVVEAHLEDMGATVRCAEGGDAALDLLASEHFDLVFLDMNMPSPDGLETFRRLRAGHGKRPDVPVIAMTANALPEHRATYIAAGLDGYLAKPLSTETLCNTLREVLPPHQVQT